MPWAPPRTPSWPSAPLLPWPLSTRPSGSRAGPEMRAPAVVLEARQHPRAGAEVDLDRDVADQPRAGVAHGLEVDEPDAGEPLAAELVGVAEQLVAAADGEDDAPALGRGVQRVALDGGEVLRAQLLVTVLTTPEVEQVVGVGIDLVAEARRRTARSRSRATRSGARAAAGCRGRRRCSSGPDTARRPAGRRQPRSITTVEPRWASVSAIRPRRLGPQPAGAALGLEVGRAERRERDRVVLARARAVRGGQHAHALQHDAVAAAPDRDREGAVAPAVALGRVGRQRVRARRPRTARAPRRRASATRPPLARCSRAEARNAARAARPGSSWIVCIGTTIRPNGGPGELEAGGVGLLGAHLEAVALARARASSASSSASRSSAVTSWPRAGEVERDAARARADVEHRARLGGSPARATAAGRRA